MAAPMDPYLYPVEKRHVHSIGRRIEAEAMVYCPDVLDTVFQRWPAAAVTADILQGEGVRLGISTNRK